MILGPKSARSRCVHAPLLLRFDICSQFWFRHNSLGWMFVLHRHLRESIAWMEDGEAQCCYQDHTKPVSAWETQQNGDRKAIHTHCPTRYIHFLSA